MPKKDTVAAEDVEAAEVAKIETVALNFDPDPHFARGDCRDAMLEVLRSTVDWSKLDQNRQIDINAAINEASKTIIRKIVNALASEGRATVVCKLDQVTIKDGIKLALSSGFSHDSMVMLAEAQGKTIQLVMSDMATHDHQRAPAAVDPDQPDLLPEGGGDVDLVDQPDTVEGDPPAEGDTVHDVQIKDEPQPVE